jgi:hypothetical protein
MFWIDAGITNTIHPGYFTHDKVLDKLNKYVNKFHFVCFPYETTTEIHGFEINSMNNYSQSKVNRVARGGFFGGKKEVINDINTLYYMLMNDSLSKGYMGTEESIFTIMTYLYPNLVNYSMIEGNGLMGKFFEDLKDDKLEILNDKVKINEHHSNDISKVGLYVITFNSPKQFPRLVQTKVFLSLGPASLQNPHMQSILSKIPLNRILFETDDTATDINQVYRDYSQATSTPLEEVNAQIEQNFLAIFGA